MTTNPYEAPIAEESPAVAGPRMTGTAYRRGLVNAFICVVPAFGGCWLLSLGIEAATGWSPLASRSAAIAGLVVLAAGTNVIMWLRGLQNRGPVLLDCGGRPSRTLFFVQAAFYFLLGLYGTSLQGMFGRFGGLFGIVFAFFWLLMGLSRLSVHQNGLWVYAGLVRWEKIKSYSWKDDNTLVYSNFSRLPFLSRGALPVPAECVDEMRRLLKEYVPVPAVE